MDLPSHRISPITLHFTDTFAEMIDSHYEIVKWRDMFPDYKKDKRFQAWLWLKNKELKVRDASEEREWYPLFFDKPPTKKAVMELIELSLSDRTS